MGTLDFMALIYEMINREGDGGKYSEKENFACFAYFAYSAHFAYSAYSANSAFSAYSVEGVE